MNEVARYLSIAISSTLVCIAAVAARALRGFSRHELEEICRRRDAQARLRAILLYHDRAAQAADTLFALAAATLVVLSAEFAWSASAALAAPRFAAVAWAVVLGAILLLAAGVWVPAAVARLWAAPVVFRTWPLWRTLMRVFAPLELCRRFFDTLLHRLAGREAKSPSEESLEEEIRTIVTEGHREGLLQTEAREMIEGVIELADADVSEIMTPRTDMVCLHVGLSLREAIDFVIQAGHTRIPVYEKNRDDIVGLLYAKDVLPEIIRQPAEPPRPLAEILRRPYYVPETKPVNALLQEFQRTRNHMAIVLDEFGGVSGLVTIEDVVEEIVGEIVDEYDKDLVEGVKRIDNRTSESLGRVHIDELNERLGLELSEEGDFDTIGGFIFSELGHVPTIGEEVVHDNVRITVVDATSRRVERVKNEVLDAPERESA